MSLQPVQPSIFAEPRGAFMAAHAANMPNPTAGLGEGLSRLGEGLGRAAQGINARLDREKSEQDDLLLKRSLAEYEAEKAEGFDNQVYSKEGPDVSGARERAMVVLSTAEKRQMEILRERDPKLAERFSIYALNDKADQMPRVAAYERGQARQVRAHTDRLKSDQDALVLNKVRAEFDAAISEGMTGILSLSGASAMGAKARAEALFVATAKPLVDGLHERDPRLAEEFKIHVLRSQTSRMAGVASYEREETRKALVATEGELSSWEAKLYSETGDEANLAGIVEHHSAAWETSGRRMITPEKLEAFDNLAERGEFLINGEKLTIVEGEDSQEPGTISRAKVVDLRERLVKENEIYMQDRQDQLDVAHGARVDAFLKSGQLDSALNYLGNNPGGERGYGMSPRAWKLLASRVSKHVEVRAVEDLANNSAEVVLAEGVSLDTEGENRSQSGRYWSENMEQALLAERKRLSDAISEAPPDEKEKASRALDIFDNRMAREKKLRLETEKADIQTGMLHLRDKKLLDESNLELCASEIAKMPDSPVRDHFVDTWARNRRAVDERVSSQPEVKRARSAQLARFKRYMALKEPLEIDGRQYDLSNPEQLSVAVRSVGMGTAEIEDIKAYFTNPRLPYHTATTMLADRLNQLNGLKPDPEEGELYFTADNVTAIMPEILVELETAAKAMPELDMESKEGRAWLGQTMLELLVTKQRVEPGFFGKRAAPLHDYLRDAVKEDGSLRSPKQGEERLTYENFRKLSMTREQIREEMKYKKLLKTRALQLPMVGLDPNTTDVDAYAKEMGYTPDMIKFDEVYAPKDEKEKRDAVKKKAAREKARQDKEDDDARRKANARRPKHTRMTVSPYGW